MNTLQTIALFAGIWCILAVLANRCTRKRAQEQAAKRDAAIAALNQFEEAYYSMTAEDAELVTIALTELHTPAE